MDVPIGRTARSLRDTLGLTQREMAEALGITTVHLSNIENGKAIPSPALLDKFREVWDIDLYVLAWCQLGDSGKLPERLRNAASDIETTWKRQIEDFISRRRGTEAAQ